MGVLEAVALAALVLLVTVAVRRFMPAGIEGMTRQFDVGPVTGWSLYAVWLVGLVAPVALGAPFGDAGLALPVGMALYSGGAYLLAIALSSRDERRAVRSADRVPPGSVGTAAAGNGTAPVVTSGTAASESPVRTLVDGAPAVRSDWRVGERRSVLWRTNWHTLATGSRSAPFGLDGEGDRLRVEPGGRTFGGETVITSYDPDEPLPGTAATLFDRHDDLPAAADRERPVRIVEEYVPVGPVTVAGVPRTEAGTVVLERGPADGLLGSDGGDDGHPEVVVVAGDVETARRQLRKRVVWLGLAGGAMVAVGQAVAFLFTPATLPLL
jgi:hypothetical protein